MLPQLGPCRTASVVSATPKNKIPSTGRPRGSRVGSRSQMRIAFRLEAAGEIGACRPEQCGGRQDL